MTLSSCAIRLFPTESTCSFCRLSTPSSFVIRFAKRERRQVGQRVQAAMWVMLLKDRSRASR